MCHHIYTNYNEILSAPIVEVVVVVVVVHYCATTYILNILDLQMFLHFQTNFPTFSDIFRRFPMFPDVSRRFCLFRIFQRFLTFSDITMMSGCIE